MESIQLTESWITNNRKDYVLYDRTDKLVVFKKIGDDDREWNQHVKF